MVLKVCAEPGCSELVLRGRCAEHEPRRVLDRERSSARARGYDRRWEKARQTFLATHPACEHCRLEGATVEATVVDHIVPHRGDRRLFWLKGNWQGLCSPCHQAKGMRESGLLGCEHQAPPRVVDGRTVCVLCGGEA